jgi:comEA protein
MIDLFTKQEKIFISFLLFAIIVGAGIKIYKSYFTTTWQIEQSATADEIGKQIQAKAAQIDSLLPAKALTFGNVDYSTGKIRKDSSISPGVNANASLSVELNTATVSELEQLPHIGPVLSDRIVKYRDIYGEFNSIEDLTKVKGIGNKKLNYIKPYIYIKQK